MKKQFAISLITSFIFISSFLLTSCNGIPAKAENTVAQVSIIPSPTPVSETTSIPAETQKPNPVPSAATSMPAKTQKPSPVPSETAPIPILPNYTVYPVGSSELLDSEEIPWADDLSFNIIQVKEMEDEVLQKKINKSILEAMTHWVEDFESFHPNRISLIPADIDNPTVYLQSDSYLSINNRFDTPYSNNNWASVHDVITVDIKTGERVMLNDLFRVDDLFAAKILTSAENIDYMKGYICEPEELLEKLSGASLNNLELAKKNPTRAGILLSRTSFHLEENKLVITFHYSGARDLEDFDNYVIKLDDLEDFLLVEQWWK